MTTEFNVLENEYENVEITAKAFDRTREHDAFVCLCISLEGSKVNFFVDAKNRESFAERVYEALMSAPKANEEAQSGGRAEQ